eukprot:TRINITY_DN411_c1_g1_i1.p1 TRINITY_DN411_c1_g1~~TRINITY_DN411_c1_g1_i1.p1  ORF type:complete len:630 (-),score=86.53 TRINITY_DN411_c1_g1_i1:240-2063(-)
MDHYDFQSCLNLTFPYCCMVQSYSLNISMDKDHWVEYSVYNRSLVFICLISMLFLYWQLKNNLFRHVGLYFKYLSCFGVYIVLKLGYLLSPLELIPMANLIVELILRCLDFALELWLLSFLFQKNLLAPSVRKASIATVVVLMVSSPVDMVPFLTLDADDNMKFIGVTVSDFLFFVGLLVIAMMTTSSCQLLVPAKYLPRKSARLWALYKALIHLLNAVYRVMMMQHEDLACASVVSSLVDYCLVALVLYFVLRSDALYWQKKRQLLQDDEWIVSEEGKVIEVNQSKIEQVPTINWNDIKLEKTIGSGAFAVVYLAEWRRTKVAVKKLKMDSVQSGESDEKSIISDLLRETRFLSTLRHPNIVQFLGLCVTLPNLAIVTTFMERGSLYSILKSIRTGELPPTELNFDRKVSILRDIAAGMDYLHSRNPPVLHRDLKSPNVLIDQYWRGQVADFGLSRIHAANTSTMTHLGTPLWLAPEIVREERYSEKADVWSYGVIVWETVTGKHPYDKMTPLAVMAEVGFKNYKLKLSDSSSSSELKSIMDDCFNEEQLRPTFYEILHKFQEIKGGSDLTISTTTTSSTPLNEFPSMANSNSSSNDTDTNPVEGS